MVGLGGVGATDRLISSIAALFSKRGLVKVNKPTVPCHEDARVVDVQGLIDVDSDKVVKL